MILIPLKLYTSSSCFNALLHLLSSHSNSLVLSISKNYSTLVSFPHKLKQVRIAASNLQNKKGLIQTNQKRFLVKVFTEGKNVVAKVFKTFLKKGLC